MTEGPRIYNLLPSLAGPIERWKSHIDRIAAMNFNWIYVNPFHETGYSGSLYAVKDHYRLNPLFRGTATGSDDDQIRAFVARAAQAGLRVMMDLVINHTARDAVLVDAHPDWYRHDASGEIVSPSATDPGDPSMRTVWTDLAELDYSERPARDAMIGYFAGVIRHYVGLGISGFRCDAAYMVPADVWASLIDEARATAPGVRFAGENLGAPLEAVAGLRSAGFDYLFNSAKWWDFRADWLLEQYDRFRRIAPTIAFPESHDTARLVAELDARTPAEIEARYRLEYLFSAFFSTGVMMPMGYEYGFERQFDVVMTRPEHWEKPRFDLMPFIAAANAMKAAIPALNEEGPQRALQRAGQTFALIRRSENRQSTAVALVNPDAAEPLTVDARSLLRPAGGSALVDLTPGSDGTALRTIVLAPLEMRVFADAPDRIAPKDEPRAAEGPAAARPCVIEAVEPQIDCGRHAVKCIVGDRIEVAADVFREGHDAVAAVVRYRESGAGDWYEAPMHHVDNDRWAGSFVVTNNGRYEYTIDAWPDAFTSWTHDVEIKHVAGQPIDLELIEGRALVAAARERAQGAGRAGLALILTQFDAAATVEERLDVLLAEQTAQLLDAAPDRSQATRYVPVLELIADRREAQIAAWYEMFPRSQSGVPGKHATFADAERALPRIRDLGFDVVYLPPVHPIGVSFRKGRNNTLDPAPGDPGSPWAIGNADGGHRSIEPQLGSLADFDRFVAAAKANGMEIAIDYALQSSPDHPYIGEHPEWFTFRADGTIKYAENPPKKYQDIVNFNWYGPHAQALWNELRDVVLFWIEHGVRIFRVDNPHTKPFAFWEWMIREVQERHPDTIFLAEAFTRPKVMNELAKLGFTQSYTYFTWRNSKRELTEYLSELAAPPLTLYYRPNFFANTPDILPPFLQTGGRPAFLIRLYLAATLSSLYGIYSGFEVCENAALPGREEYADSEKYQITVRDWDAPGNINAEIRRINRIRRENPALWDWRNIRFLDSGNDDVLFYMKTAGPNVLLIAVNLDPNRAVGTLLRFPLGDLGIEAGEEYAFENVLTGERHSWRGPLVTVTLNPLVNPAVIFRVDAKDRAERV